MHPIYLDYNATTPLCAEAKEAMTAALEHFGNPSSSHAYGKEAKGVVETARLSLAKLLGASPSEIVFTGGGSEANNYALKGVVWSLKEKGNHIITSGIEHPAILKPCQFLEKQGYAITYLPVDEYGLVDPQAVRKALTPKTILITIMHANNEVGTIEPLEEIARIAKEAGVLLHTDAAQTVGKVPARVQELGVDLLTVAGHKFYGPKGVGALYIRSGLKLESLIHGAGHEGGRRAGTENVVLIAGLGAAAQAAGRDLEKNFNHYQTLRDRLHNKLLQGGAKIKLNGHPELRLPNTLNLSFLGLVGEEILGRIPEIAASTGSACHAGSVEPSGVLLNMGIPPNIALGAVRFSVGRETTEGEIEKAAEMVLHFLKTEY
jgi:cysteine desulfurase